MSAVKSASHRRVSRFCQAPSQAQLQALWAMLAQLLQNGGGTPPQGWDALGEWALLPLSAGGVVHCAVCSAGCCAFCRQYSTRC